MSTRSFTLIIAATLTLTATSAPAAAVLYGITATDLITIDPLNPNNITVVGPHNFNSGVPYTLTYDATNHALVALAHDGITNSLRRSLVQFDLLTGQSNVLATLHNIAEGAEDALEYIDSRASLLVTRGPPTSGSSVQTYDMDLAGNQTFIVTLNVTDNDAAVYDSSRDIFYTFDANNVQLFMEIDLATGNGTPHGPLPSNAALEGAYSPDLDRIFLREGPSNVLYVTDADPNNINFQNGGTIAGNPVLGIAFVSAETIPAPAALVPSLTLLAALTARRRPRIA